MTFRVLSRQLLFLPISFTLSNSDPSSQPTLLPSRCTHTPYFSSLAPSSSILLLFQNLCANSPPPPLHNKLSSTDNLTVLQPPLALLTPSTNASSPATPNKRAPTFSSAPQAPTLTRSPIPRDKTCASSSGQPVPPPPHQT